MYCFSSDAQCKLLSAQAAGIKHLYFTWCDGNHQCQPWQNSSQNSVFMTGDECHRHVAEFMLHKCTKICKSKFRALSTLALNMPKQGRKISVSLPKHLVRTPQLRRTQILHLQPNISTQEGQSKTVSSSLCLTSLWAHPTIPWCPAESLLMCIPIVC